MTEKNGVKYYAVDNHFGHHKYGYIELDKLETQEYMTEEEFNKL